MKFYEGNRTQIEMEPKKGLGHGQPNTYIIQHIAIWDDRRQGSLGIRGILTICGRNRGELEGLEFHIVWKLISSSRWSSNFGMALATQP